VEQVTIRVNGRPTSIPCGTTVASAIAAAGKAAFRTSTTGAARGPLCGMGICGECRVTVDGVRHQRSCVITCRDGMEVVTDG
jgi:aerobic-type carbon monoxide dehydrogenase small subunit (CoxS/CutS family)